MFPNLVEYIQHVVIEITRWLYDYFALLDCLTSALQASQKKLNCVDIEHMELSFNKFT